ncbi:MAG: translation initiation factor IF-6 [Methanomicrobiales archaeon]|nr:translation initiation factor IF-6 [Methanomicrobiales archaeon]
MGHSLDFAGDPHIGVFARVIGDYAIVPPVAPEIFVQTIREELGVELIATTIQESSIIGSLVAGNRYGMVVSGLASEHEIGALQEHAEVFLLRSSMNAAGNVILANDSLAIVHPDMEELLAEEIGEFLHVPVHRLTFGGVKTVGMVGVATNKGLLLHPRTTRNELRALAEITTLPVGTGSVNMGSMLVGSGLLVNDQGYVAGTETSGFELGRIEEVFGFLEE